MAYSSLSSSLHVRHLLEIVLADLATCSSIRNDLDGNAVRLGVFFLAFAVWLGNMPLLSELRVWRGPIMKMQFLAAVWLGMVCTGGSHAGTRSFALPNVVGKQFVEIMRQGDVRAFADLLKTLPRPNISRVVVDEKGNTLLHLLAQHGRADMIALAYLMSGNRLDAGVRNDTGGSAQQLAEDCGHDEACSLLRSLQAVPPPSTGAVAIHYLLRRVQPRDPLWRDYYFHLRKSLMHAARRGEYGAVVVLVNAMHLVEEMGLTNIDGIDMRSEFSYSKWLALEKAMYAHDTEVFDFLVANGAAAAEHLHTAAIANNVHAINSLLAAGVDVDARGGALPPP